MDFMDKASGFLAAVNEAGINFSNLDGDTAVICNDCVAVVSKHGDEVGVNFINMVEKMDYTIGFTKEDVEEFELMDELTGGGEDAGD